MPSMPWNDPSKKKFFFRGPGSRWIKHGWNWDRTGAKDGIIGNWFYPPKRR